MRLRVVDIETTGFAPPAEIIELGQVDVVTEGSDWRVERPKARLFRPLRGIPPETTAVHHITESDIESGSPACSLELLRHEVLGEQRPDALVAHNAAFERRFISASATDDVPWICTYKAASRAWPEAPRHSNQELRHWRNLVLDDRLAAPPHRAAPDAYVTAHLLVDLLKVVSVDQMVLETREPRSLPNIPFGKHRGLRWSDAPNNYLLWMVRQSEMNASAKWSAELELSRRARAA